MMASDGLTTIDGSGSAGRRPGRSSRVKQSCRLLKPVLRASDRSRSENSRQQAIERSRTRGFSILLNQPMKRVRAARGTRLVSRKFRSSCWVKVAMRLLTVMNLSEGLVSAFVMDSQLPAGFLKLASVYKDRFARSRQMTSEAARQISDLQFTQSYRVPFQYSRLVRENLGAGSFMEASAGVTLTDLDGNLFYDLAGSYGVNIFGNDFYKECIAGAEKRAQALGPVLGFYHPVVAENVKRLVEISGLDEVSFHMSGTEAVMQAVRLARYHTKRSHLVRFAGAYHGWWGDVQPGVGNPISPHETYTLADMSERTLHVLKTRNDIACVLVNPLQALHPNANAPGDSALVDSSRSANFDRAAYGEWLKELRQVCTERNVVLIFDEVFVGFRLAAGGAQEYFGVRARSE